MPPIPGVGDRSRIAQLLLGMQSEDMQTGLQERALGQAGTQQFTDLVGLDDLLGKGLGLFTLGKEQQFAAEQAAKQREFESEQSALDRELEKSLFERQLRDRALSDLSSALEAERGRQFGVEQDQVLGLEGDIRRRQLEGRTDELTARENLRKDLASRRAERTRQRERQQNIREGRLTEDLREQAALERLREQLGARRELAREEREFQPPFGPEEARQAAIIELLENQLSAVDPETGLPIVDTGEELDALLEGIFGGRGRGSQAGGGLQGGIEPIQPRVLPRFQPGGGEFENAATLPIERRTAERRARAPEIDAGAGVGAGLGAIRDFFAQPFQAAAEFEQENLIPIERPSIEERRRRSAAIKDAILRELGLR